MNLLAIFKSKTKFHEKIPEITIAPREPEHAAFLAQFKNMAVALALKKMFEDSHFSICTVDQLCKVTGTRIDADVYNSLHLLHCVHWNQMPREMRQAVYKILTDVFCGSEE